MLISIDTSNNIKTNEFDKWEGYTKFKSIKDIISENIDLSNVLTQTSKSSSVSNSFALKDVTETRSSIKYFFNSIHSRNTNENTNISPIIYVYEFSLFKDENNLTKVPESTTKEFIVKLKDYLDNKMFLINERGQNDLDIIKETESIKIELHNIDKESNPERHKELVDKLENLKNILLPINKNIQIKMEYDIKMHNGKVVLEMPSISEMVNNKTNEVKHFLMNSKNLAVYLEPFAKEMSTYKQTFLIGFHKTNMEKLGMEYNEENYIKYLKEQKIEKVNVIKQDKEIDEDLKIIKGQEVPKEVAKNFLGVNKINQNVESTPQIKENVVSPSNIETQPTQKQELPKSVSNVGTTSLNVDDDKLEIDSITLAEVIKGQNLIFKKEIKTEEDEISKLEKELERRKNENMERMVLSSAITKAENQIQELTKSNLTLKDVNSELIKIKNETIDKLIEEEEISAQKTEQLEKAYIEISDKNDIIIEKDNEIRNQNEVIENQENELDKKDEIITNKEKELIGKDNEIKNLNGVINNKDEIITNKDLEIDTLNNSLNDEKEKVALLTKKLDEETLKTKELSGMLSEYKSMMEEMKEFIKEMKISNDKKDLVISSLETEKVESLETINKLKSEKEKMKNDFVSQYNNLKETKNAELKNKDEIINNKDNELQNKDNVINELNKTLETNLIELQDVSIKNTELSDCNEELQEEILKRDNIIKSKNEEINNLNLDLAKIETSNKVKNDILKKEENDFMKQIKMEGKLDEKKREKGNANEFLKTVVKTGGSNPTPSNN